MNNGKTFFSLPEDIHYMNCAYMSPASKRVAAAGEAGIRMIANPSAISSDDFFRTSGAVRELFARLIGAPDPGRVAIVPSVSYGIAQVARNTPLEKGQSVVMVAQEFPSSHYVWTRRCEIAGARVVKVPPPPAGPDQAAGWSEAILEAIRPDTAVVTLSSVHWTDGTLFDLQRIGERARQVGAAFIIDGTQSIGAVPFDLAALQPDAVICAAYKWLTGPYSIGAAWLGERYDDGVPIEEAWMVREKSDDFAGLVDYNDRYRAAARRYDVGESANFILMPMLRAALEQVLEWGPERIEAHGRDLTTALVQELPDHGFWVPPDRWRAGHLFGIRLPEGTDPREVAARMQERKIFVSVRGTAVRVSLHLFNDDADVAALREALIS